MIFFNNHTKISIKPISQKLSMVSLTHSGVRGKKKKKKKRKETTQERNRKGFRDFPGGPVVKTFNAGGMGLIPSWRAKIPHALQSKKPKHKTETIL